MSVDNIKIVAVLGAGTMGNGIAHVFARLMRSLTALLLASLVLGPAPHVWANDSAAAVAAGGLRLRREARVSMESEHLTISRTKVIVEYEFRNESQQDIETEVAFPIPPYRFDPESAGGTRDFAYFRVWIDGQETKYSTEARARLRGKDYTGLLRELNINIETFGNCDVTYATGPPDSKYQVLKLPVPDRMKLRRLGLIDEHADDWPEWQVAKTYYWKQRFAVGKTVHVRHEYEPAFGFTYLSLADLDPAKRKKNLVELRKRAKTDSNISAGLEWEVMLAKQMDNLCIHPSLTKQVVQDAQQEYKNDRAGDLQEGSIIRLEWMNYILTTANSWKTPIKDFQLVIRPPEPDGGRAWHVSASWAGPLEKTADGRLIARVSNFVPNKELSVGFMQVTPSFQ